MCKKQHFVLNCAISEPRIYKKTCQAVYYLPKNWATAQNGQKIKKIF